MIFSRTSHVFSIKYRQNMTVGGDSGGPPTCALDLDVKASADTLEDHDGAPPSTFDTVDDAALALHKQASPISP